MYAEILLDIQQFVFHIADKVTVFITISKLSAAFILSPPIYIRYNKPATTSLH